MERTELTYILPYREKGKKLTKEIKLSFVSNGARRDYFSLEAERARTGALWGEYQMKVAERAAAIARKESPESIEAEIESISEQITNIGTPDFFGRRYDLIRRLLIDNGVKDSDKLTSREFWEDCVDVNELLDFLKTAINKDTESPNVKKNQETMN